MSEKKLTHIDSEGKARMVDVGEKPIQKRKAEAEGFIKLQMSTVKLIKANKMKKGDVLTVAEIAGIQGAKRTAELIPLCHNLLLTKVKVNAMLTDYGVYVTSEVHCNGQTGVEMEALSGVSIALLTIYDMCKAVDPQMELGEIKLVKKTKQNLKRPE
ncbi:MAG: cyclic pyranopterin monophosphate synthase MoaC [Prolixibacteraceae bacterium]